MTGETEYQFNGLPQKVDVATLSAVSNLQFADQRRIQPEGLGLTDSNSISLFMGVQPFFQGLSYAGVTGTVEQTRAQSSSIYEKQNAQVTLPITSPELAASLLDHETMVAYLLGVTGEALSYLNSICGGDPVLWRKALGTSFNPKLWEQGYYANVDLDLLKHAGVIHDNGKLLRIFQSIVLHSALNEHLIRSHPDTGVLLLDNVAREFRIEPGKEQAVQYLKDGVRYHQLNPELRLRKHPQPHFEPQAYPEDISPEVIAALPMEFRWITLVDSIIAGTARTRALAVGALNARGHHVSHAGWQEVHKGFGDLLAEAKAVKLNPNREKFNEEALAKHFAALGVLEYALKAHYQRIKKDPGAFQNGLRELVAGFDIIDPVRNQGILMPIIGGCFIDKALQYQGKKLLPLLNPNRRYAI